VIALRHRQRCLIVNKLPQDMPRYWPRSSCNFADVAQRVARDLAKARATGSTPVIRSISGVPVRHRLHAALGRAWRDVHGVAPHVQRATRAGPESAARVQTQPKWRHQFLCRVRLDGPGHLTFTQEIAGSNPAHDASNRSALVRKDTCAETDHKDWVVPELVTGLDTRSVNSVARVPPCPGGSRGFDSLTGRHHLFCLVSSTDQSTGLRSRGLHVRIVCGAPSISGSRAALAAVRPIEHARCWRNWQRSGLQSRRFAVRLRGAVPVFFLARFPGEPFFSRVAQWQSTRSISERSQVRCRPREPVFKSSRCSAVGSARALGAWGRRFEPCHRDQFDACVWAWP